MEKFFINALQIDSLSNGYQRSTRNSWPAHQVSSDYGEMIADIQDH